MSKTTQTLNALKEIALKNPYCEVKLLLTIHDGEITGFDQLEPVKIKFRAKKNGKDEDGE